MVAEVEGGALGAVREGGGEDRLGGGGGELAELVVVRELVVEVRAGEGEGGEDLLVFGDGEGAGARGCGGEGFEQRGLAEAGGGGGPEDGAAELAGARGGRGRR